MKQACPRSWEVEAARLGQLRGSQLQTHHEHVASGCAACVSEARRLAALTRWLCSVELPVDEVALRRLRGATLARAHSKVAASRALLPGAGRVLRLCAAFGSGALLAVWAMAAASERPAQALHTQEPLVSASSSALHVAAARSAEPAPAAALPAPVASSSNNKAPAPRHSRARRSQLDAASPPSKPDVESSVSSARPDLVDEQAEDAAYLRLLRLWRTHRGQSAQLVAADYLARFPNGFRRIEVEQLLLSIEAPRATSADWGTLGAPRQKAPTAP